jgi:AcrR family transcriptional regulator
MKLEKENLRTQNITLAQEEQSMPRTTTKKEKRLAEIYQAACEVLNEKKSNDFKVKDVADRIGIGRGTLYEVIRTKNDIIYIVLKQRLNEAIQYVQEKTEVYFSHDPWMALQMAIKAHLECVSMNPKFLYIMYQESTPINKSQFKEILELIERYNDIFTQIITKGGEEGIFKVDDPYLIAHCLTNTLNTWVIKKNHLNYKFEINGFEKSVGRMVLQGIIDLEGEKALQNLERLKNL